MNSPELTFLAFFGNDILEDKRISVMVDSNRSSPMMLAVYF